MCICKTNIKLNGILHSKYAQNLVDAITLKGIKSMVYVKYNESVVNAKSIVGLLTLGLRVGDTISVIVTYDNEEECNSDFRIVVELFKNIFN